MNDAPNIKSEFLVELTFDFISGHAHNMRHDVDFLRIMLREIRALSSKKAIDPDRIVSSIARAENALARLDGALDTLRELRKTISEEYSEAKQARFAIAYHLQAIATHATARSDFHLAAQYGVAGVALVVAAFEYTAHPSFEPANVGVSLDLSAMPKRGKLIIDAPGLPARLFSRAYKDGVVAIGKDDSGNDAISVVTRMFLGRCGWTRVRTSIVASGIVEIVFE